MQRKGKVFADRYHAHVLRTPTEAANALRYVLQNFRHHLRQDVAPTGIDPCSSAAWIGRDSAEPPVCAARTWLLKNAAAFPLRSCA